MSYELKAAIKKIGTHRFNFGLYKGAKSNQVLITPQPPTTKLIAEMEKEIGDAHLAAKGVCYFIGTQLTFATKLEPSPFWVTMATKILRERVAASHAPAVFLRLGKDEPDEVSVLLNESTSDLSEQTPKTTPSETNVPQTEESSLESPMERLTHIFEGLIPRVKQAAANHPDRKGDFGQLLNEFKEAKGSGDLAKGKRASVELNSLVRELEEKQMTPPPSITPPAPNPQLVRQRQELVGVKQSLENARKPTQVTYEFSDMGKTIRPRLVDGAAATLRGRAASLAKEEKDLKDSSRFIAMMNALREYEAATVRPGGNQFAAKDKRNVLRNAALVMRDHYAAEHPKDIAKPNSSRGRGYAAAVKVIVDIDAAENDRISAIQDFKNLMVDLKQQVDQRESGGNQPIDFGAIAVLEKLGQDQNMPTEINTVLPGLLKRARLVEGRVWSGALGQPTDSLRQEFFEAKSAICLRFGTCKAPSGSAGGASDSFFLKDQDGNPSFVFKPMEGEADQSAYGWEKGGAAPRELLASALNDQLGALGLDCGISKTSLVTLDDPALKGGKNSDAGTRTGALQQFAPNDMSMLKLVGSPSSNVDEEELEDYCAEPQELARRKQMINKQDLQKIALFDLISLNLDRSPANMLVRYEGQDPNKTIRLIPIDGGNLLPPRSALEQGIGGLEPSPRDPQQPLAETSNAIMQLPQAGEDFDPILSAKIDQLDPDALSGGLKSTYQRIGQQSPGMQGKVKEPEVFDMMKLSTQLLKRACGSKANPRLTPADMAEMYHKELLPFFDRVLGPTNSQPGAQPFVRPGAQWIEAEMDRMIGEQAGRRVENARVAQLNVEIKQLGGSTALTDLGWPHTLISDDPDRALDVLKKQEEEPGMARDYQAAGGDADLQRLGVDPGSIPLTRDRLSRLNDLLADEAYLQAGGDGALRQAYENARPAMVAFNRAEEVWRAAKTSQPQPQWVEWMKQNPPPATTLPTEALINSIDNLLRTFGVRQRLDVLQKLRKYLANPQ